MSNDHKINISKSLKGRKVWNKGIKIGSPTKETRKKISLAVSNSLKGHFVSEETKIKISNSLKRNTNTKGKKRSIESRKKMSLVQKGNTNGFKKGNKFYKMRKNNSIDKNIFETEGFLSINGNNQS